MNSIDLDGEIERKIAKNARRQYSQDGNGVPFRVSEPVIDPLQPGADRS
ncbi:MAG TPA: hypothetical protein VK784_08165 [Pseudonocardiaceae bacterium]|jgi:hypothetical protein|nr:hypothetical protein [Pseudonocardiaceae bacterium]